VEDGASGSVVKPWAARDRDHRRSSRGSLGAHGLRAWAAAVRSVGSVQFRPAAHSVPMGQAYLTI
jgi:hypothetical protein